MNLQDLIKLGLSAEYKSLMKWQAEFDFNRIDASANQIKVVAPLRDKMLELISNKELMSLFYQIQTNYEYDWPGEVILAVNSGKDYVKDNRRMRKLSLFGSSVKPFFLNTDCNHGNAVPLAYCKTPSVREVRELRKLMRSPIFFQSNSRGGMSYYKGKGLTPEILEDSVCRYLAKNYGVSEYKSNKKLLK